MSLATVACLGAPAALGAARPPVFVVTVANSESFDPTLGDLRFSRDDGQRFRDVMVRAGGVTANQLLTLNDATVAGFREAMGRVAANAKAHGAVKGAKLVFYFTGHSDVNGIHMQDGLLRRDELHQLIAAVPVETRVAILDSCYSGALTEKGIRPAEAFTVPVAEIDEPTGSVFLAATSSSDLAFEVDELGGSTFTHHLVAGLYGQADGDDDGLVTIDEAYQYVYRQMQLQAAVLPTPTAQKPEYSNRLKGQGALVLAFVKESSVPVTLDAMLDGEVTLAADKGLRIFRLTKRRGETKRVLVVPGDYNVIVKNDKQVGQGDLRVAANEPVTLLSSDLVYSTPSQAISKAKGRATAWSYELEAGTHTSSFGLVGPSLELRLLTPGGKIGAMTYRAFVQAGGHSNILEYRGAEGRAVSLSGLVGGTASFFVDDALDGQQIFVLAGTGTDYVKQTWDGTDEAGNDVREFKPTIPKISLGVGTLIPTDSGLVFGVGFRREWLFATDAQADDVYAFSASLLSFLVGF